MGKKKEQQIKELAVAIDEASSTGDERGPNQSQPQTLRKRGRPRKIVEKIAGGDHQLAAGVDADDAEESMEKALEKNKISKEIGGREFVHVDSSSARTTWITKEDGVSSHSREAELFRSRKARRKSKPRKSC